MKLVVFLGEDPDYKTWAWIDIPSEIEKRLGPCLPEIRFLWDPRRGVPRILEPIP